MRLLEYLRSNATRVCECAWLVRLKKERSEGTRSYMRLLDYLRSNATRVCECA